MVLSPRYIRIFGSLFILLVMPLALFGQVGINNNDPKTTLDVNGALALREGAPLATGNKNNLSLGPNPHSVYRFEGSSADFNISGIVPATGADGQLLVLVNGTAGKMTILHESSLSTAENRIIVPGARDLTLTGNFSTLMLLYNKGLDRWVVLNKSSHIEVRTLFVASLPTGPSVFSYSIPEATRLSSSSVNFVKRSTPLPDYPSADLYIEYVETRDGSVIFRVRNDGAALDNVEFAIVINIV